MTRYIDENDFLDLFYVASAGQDKAFIAAVEMVIADTPTADVVEVVRCRDCEWRYTDECPMRYEEVISWDEDGWTENETNVHDSTYDNGFCCFGERRRNEGEKEVCCD